MRSLFYCLLFALPFTALRPSPDFVISETSWQKEKIGEIIIKSASLPRLLHDAVKWTTQRLIMSQLYPAQNSIRKWNTLRFQAKHLADERELIAHELALKNFEYKHVILEKNGLRFSAFAISHKDHAENGKWALQATGNKGPIEKHAIDYAQQYHKINYNLLLVNGPGVGLSEGSATPKTSGSAQEAGIRYLEEVIGAKKIVLAGFSLGGAAIGQAILSHQFRKDKEYLVIRQMTFDRTSNILKHYAKVLYPYLKPFVGQIVRWSDCEMDSVAASKKLSELEIPEVIIQAGNQTAFTDDGIIPTKSTLGYRLLKEGLGDYTKQFHRIHDAIHVIPFEHTLGAISNWN